jgi:hypothetical protein
VGEAATASGLVCRILALPFAVRVKDEAPDIIARRGLPGTTVHADEAAHWDVLHGKFAARRIDHGFAFSDDGAGAHQAESFFSRLRRAGSGQHHHISGVYLKFYAGETAWREDMRREAYSDQFEQCTADALTHPKRRNWCGCWQRH